MLALAIQYFTCLKQLNCDIIGALHRWLYAPTSVSCSCGHVGEVNKYLNLCSIMTLSSPTFPQVNHVTAWIDGSSIYGCSSSWCDALRGFSGGRLAVAPEANHPRWADSSYFMWNSVDPSTGQHGPHGLYGKNPSHCSKLVMELT